MSGRRSVALLWPYLLLSVFSLILSARNRQNFKISKWTKQPKHRFGLSWSLPTTCIHAFRLSDRMCVCCLSCAISANAGLQAEIFECGVCRCLCGGLRLCSPRFVLTTLCPLGYTTGTKSTADVQFSRLYDIYRSANQGRIAGTGTNRIVVCPETASRQVKRIPVISEKLHRHRSSG